MFNYINTMLCDMYIYTLYYIKKQLLLVFYKHFLSIFKHFKKLKNLKKNIFQNFDFF